MADLFLDGLSQSQKRSLAIIVVVGGGAGANQIKKALRSAAREQQELAMGTERKDKPLKHKAVAVDAIFASRLRKILSICVPGPLSAEAGLIYAQGGLLIARTMLSDYISRLEGQTGRYIISSDGSKVRRTMALFVAASIPAAVVNSGLKYMQKRIKLAFQRRLTLQLHELYCNNRAYFAASTLRGLTGADQRITEDVEKFTYAISELYSYTFKPLLDVVLFTHSLSGIMGYKSQLALYGYYFCCASVLRKTSPPLALMTAQETALTGAFRQAHQRLVQNAEEVAFNDPPAGMAEQMILNQHLYRMLRHSRLSAFQHFVQQVLDGFFVKYGATAVALLVYALPFIFDSNNPRAGSGHATQNYIRAMRLLGNTSKGIGDLVLIYKRITGLAGHTSRVSELLEQVKNLSSDNPERVHTQLYLRNVSSSGSLAHAAGPGPAGLDPLPEPRRHEGPTIRFDRVTLTSPDGTTLVRGLTFDVTPGRSVMIMGPNGSGKSSLFRVAAGLWPLQAGEITLPPKGQLFYLSQRPYLVSGTLRDQLLYPEPPRDVLAVASPASRARVAPWATSAAYPSREALDERLAQCLEAVELDGLAARGRGLDQVQAWTETLSGGEKQRLAMARLLFHAPAYAVLDECTSAVSADGELALYRAAIRAGITVLSIGHRPALKGFHSRIVHFEGGDGGKGWTVEELRDRDSDGLAGTGA
ncbi:hypothetical protein ACKKBG_A12265 [Auxenochlorella protothecoides x Auxenochlorella symbiontica]|uniref:ABC transporter domain-containing protein n=1 Tax=Auxenochlorella protothecoides TaxID=3075 RepID=A0A1D2ADP6_AUXPR